MVKTMEVHNITEEDARAVMYGQLPQLMKRLVRKAHKEGSKGRKAYAEHTFTGPLFDAAVQLRDEFESCVRTYIGSEAWTVSFGYSVRLHAPGIVILRLK